jgi:hypothetical protein
MYVNCHTLAARSARRAASSPVVWSMGLVALLAASAPWAQGQPPVGPTNVATEEKVGVTVYQVNGFNGEIPLKKVYKVDPSGDTGHYELEFASGNMNTKMQWKAKFIMPPGMIFKSFELFTANGPIQVTPASADTWDGQKLIDEVTLSPWSMSHVLQQCKQQLTNPDGTFKDSATFDLQANEVDQVRGKGICTFPNAPPGSASSYSGKATPKTRVKAYIVGGGQKATVGGDATRLSSGRPAARPPSRIPTGRPSRPMPPRDTGGASVKKPATGVLVLPSGGTAAKEKFVRTKPHVNVAPSSSQPASRIVKPVRRER